MKSLTSLLAIGLLTLSACSASDPATTAALPASAPASFVINPHGNPSVDASREAMDVLTSDASRAVLSPRSPLAEAEAAAAAALASADRLSGAAASELRQTVASVMVQRYLSQPTPDVAAVGRYTDMLLAEGSPNAHLLARALPVVQASWGDARVHAAAEQAATEAAAYLDHTCPGCTARSRTAVGTAQVPDGTSMQQDIQSGIDALESI